MIKKAMILAAGFGKRLNPLTIKKPKPLLKIGNKNLLHNTLSILEKFGIEEVVINVHYLSSQIIEYCNKNNFNMKIVFIEEKDSILDTGGGILNAINYFSNKPFLIINPDTIWNMQHLDELKLMEKEFFSNNKIKCFLLVVDKKKSFDLSLSGDFNLVDKLIKREKNESSFSYIYTGMQIIKPEVFSEISLKIFSINKIWDELIKKNCLYGFESYTNFLHISTLEIYKKLKEKNFKH